MDTTEYLISAFRGYADPPDSDYQQGYLAALLELYRVLEDPQDYSDEYHRVRALLRESLTRELDCSELEAFDRLERSAMAAPSQQGIRAR
jgi:hypothetical protein